MWSPDLRAANTVTPQKALSAVKLPKHIATEVQGPKQFSVMDIEIFSFFTFFFCWFVGVFFAFPLERSAGINLFLYFKGNIYYFTWIPHKFHNGPAVCQAHITWMCDVNPWVKEK